MITPISHALQSSRRKEWERRWKTRFWALPSVISNKEGQAPSVGRDPQYLCGGALLHTLDPGPWLRILCFVFPLRHESGFALASCLVLNYLCDHTHRKQCSSKPACQTGPAPWWQSLAPPPAPVSPGLSYWQAEAPPTPWNLYLLFLSAWKAHPLPSIQLGWLVLILWNSSQGSLPLGSFCNVPVTLPSLEVPSLCLFLA